MTTMVVLAFCIPLALVVRSVARDRAEHAGDLEARATAALLVGSRDPQVLSAIVETANASSPRKTTIFLADGTVLGDLRPAGRELAEARDGRSLTATVEHGDEAVLVPVQGPAGTDVVRVVVTEDQLEEGVATAWVVLGVLAVAMVGLAVLLADRLARSLVRAGEGLRSTARRLREGDRRARATVEGPEELAEVGRELNRLADQIDTMLLAERESIADLSHRLRTPLTALRLDVDGLPAGPERDRLLGEVAALEAAVDEQIRVARGEVPRRHADEGGEVVGAVRDRLAFWSVLAHDQRRRLTMDLPDAVAPVAVGRDDLAAAVDALLGNVFRHTPAGCGATVRLLVDAGVARLQVADDGPGFADLGGLARGLSTGGSTGLGIDIARRTAEAAGGGLSIADRPEGGALVELWLPLTA